ncbi:uncharacterized protein [Chironomus tepperi]|uniref:uncharacterized protein n=1 Tax=Chironomus tepperi TaxID=113505 RepID=UPI00391EFEC0
MFDDLNRLPDIIAKEIFQYLSFEDICNALLVSTIWHEYVGSKSFCMDKLRLKIEGWHDLEIITKILQKNSRKYCAIILNNLNPMKDFAYTKTQNWKDVRIQQMRFLSTYEFYEFIAQFGINLEVLDLEKIIIVNGEETSEYSLILPKLKKLDLKQVPTTAFQIFTRYSSLKSLHFDIPAFGTQSRSLIINFFENFRHVNIEKLSICRNSLYGLSADALTSIESIIISIANSLKSIDLQDWGCCHTFERLWNQIKVSHFSFNFVSHQPRIQDLNNLMPNNNLTILKLSLLNIPAIDWSKNLFLLTTCLKYLFIGKIRKEIVYYAAVSLQKLEVFSYVSCVIDIANTEFNANDYEDIEIIEIDEEEDIDLGHEYDYIGKDEIFDLVGNNTTTIPSVIKRYSDFNSSKSFANSYYLNIRNLSYVNPNIKFHKCD